MMSADTQHGITLRSVTEALLQIEDELDLFEQTIDGVYFWERIRFVLHQKILEQAGLIEQGHLSRRALDYVKIGLRSLMNIAYRNPYGSQRSDILFFGHQRRKLQEDGKWWDIYCDPVIDILDETYVYIEQPYLGAHLSPAKTGHLRYLDLLYPLMVCGRLLRPMPRFSKSEEELLTSISSKLKQRIGVDIPVAALVRKLLLKRRSLLPLYTKLLKRVSPKLAVIVVSYGKYTFLEACKTAGIPVAELQHGTIDKYHLAYSYTDSRHVARCFPDYFLSFGEAWTDLVDLPLDTDRIVPVGYPYFDLQRDKFGGGERQNQVLFISQGTVGRELSRLAVDLQKALPGEYKVIYKLHPGEYRHWQQRYPWLAPAPLQVVDDDSVSLYGLVASAGIVVGVNSTVIYEALGLGARIVLVGLPGVESMYKLRDKASLPVISTVDELAEEIESGSSGQEVDAEKYFKRDALTNMKKSISSLVESSSVHKYNNRLLDKEEI